MLKSRLLGAVGIVAVVGAGLVAQTPGSPAFEVASIKLSKSGDTPSRMEAQQGGRFTFTNNTLRELVREAYTLQNFQIEGGPDWFDRDHFDIVTKADAAAPREQFWPMLRTLLADRFKLAAHNETRQRPIYALVMARSDARLGPQLHQLDSDCAARVAAHGGDSTPPEPGAQPLCGMRIRKGTIAAWAAPFSQLVTALSQLTNRVVLDRTALTGSFDLDLQWTPDLEPSQLPTGAASSSPSPGDGPSILTALQEQLGLKLESTTGPVDVLVIDHAEHPTPD